MTGPVKGILFLCVANSARSQMAEGLARALLPAEIRIASAGSRPGRVDPRAIAVLAEIDIDIAEHYSKSVDTVALDDFSHLITLCTEEVCPIAAGHFTREHWPMPDPVGAATGQADLAPFRSVRDELRSRLLAHFGPNSPDTA